jgi:hypothetical protein
MDVSADIFWCSVSRCLRSIKIRWVTVHRIVPCASRPPLNADRTAPSELVSGCCSNISKGLFHEQRSY